MKGSTEPPQAGDFSQHDLVNLQEVIEACDVGLCLLNAKRQLVAWNRHLADTTGKTDQEALLRPLEELIPQLAGPRFTKMVTTAVHANQADGALQTYFSLDNARHLFNIDENRFIRVSVKPLAMHPGFCLVQVCEIDDKLAKQEQLKAIGMADQRTRAMLSSVDDAVILLDAAGRVEFANLAAEGMTGYQGRLMVGRRLTEVYRVFDESGSEKNPLTLDMIKQGEGRQLVLKHREGPSLPIQQSITRLKNETGELEGLVLVFKDTSQSRKLAAQLSWQSSHDPVTRLYNRTEFDRQLTRLLEQTAIEGGEHCLLYLDVDRFKIVNDNCGHAAGDELLRQLASLIKRSIRNSDLLARLGGDEFGILLSQCTTQAAERIADSIRHSVQGFRFVFGEKSFSQSISIGMVPIDKQSKDLEQVLSHADSACFSAKDEGRNKVHIYDPIGSPAAKRHGEAKWVTHIRSALEQDRFTLFVQPIKSINSSGASEHVEVLIRMLDDSGELILPGAFIPAAERFDLMPSIDRWVIDRLIRYIAANRDDSLAAGRRYFVNLSGHSLCDEEVLEVILERIRHDEIPKGMLCFEVTETAAISNLTSAEHFMRTLQRFGCEFALDDFGSGLSSFGYLKHLPVEYLKIDGAFVKEMLDNAIDDSMVDAINRIGHIMGLETIAEFVENDRVLHRLQDIGIDYVQGFGICRPFPIEQLFASEPDRCR
ncbi:MAG: EAL domain-containing protein [Candidatus Thiodiazotropha sp.]|nr:EAL domain-containing protein [Candidatus Thiodiazotropha sp. (ex Lucina pensylvanica)]